MDLGYGETVTNPSKQGGIVAIYYLGTSIGTLMGGSLVTVSAGFERLQSAAFLQSWALPCRYVPQCHLLVYLAVVTDVDE